MRHNPRHLFFDNSAYFITAAIYQKRPLLKPNTLKQLLLTQIQKYFTNEGWTLQHWVILDNHYHLMAHSQHGKDLPNIIRCIHSQTAISIRQANAYTDKIW